MSQSIARIVSGGQTGADRGGLDGAIDRGIPHGGWCPRGRIAEDGTIPARYLLRETRSAEYAERTRRNVDDSDATVLFTRGAPKGGSAYTKECAMARGRPLLHVDLATTSEEGAIELVRGFVERVAVRTLNVAGSRESGAPGIGKTVRRVVAAVLSSARTTSSPRRAGDDA